MCKEKIPYSKRNLAFVDSETTGLDPETNEIIELAVVIYDQQQDRIIKEWEQKARPENLKTASEVALEINGYNEDPQSYKNNIRDVITQFTPIIKNCVIVGQNIQFDVSFLEKYYRHFNIESPFHRHRKLELSSLAWPILVSDDLANASLNSFCNHFGVSNEGEHRALVDCKRTLEVYRCIMKKLNHH